MFDTVNGLPLHPLVVHGVVVLLPLAILGTVLIAVVPRWRTRYGLLVVALALAATVLVPVATSSGESLERRVGDPGQHADLGGQLLWFALALLVASTLLVGLHWRTTRSAGRAGGEHGRGSVTAVTAVAVVAVLAAAACGVQVFRVGDSGARAVWGGTVSASDGG